MADAGKHRFRHHRANGRLHSSFELNLPPFPAAPWELQRPTSELSWFVVAEERGFDETPVAIVPTSEQADLAAQQEAAAKLIAAAPVLFMAGAAMLLGLEEFRGDPKSASMVSSLMREIDLLQHALDLARGRG